MSIETAREQVAVLRMERAELAGRTCPDCGHLKGMHHTDNRPKHGGCGGWGCPCRLVYFEPGRPIGVRFRVSGHSISARVPLYTDYSAVLGSPSDVVGPTPNKTGRSPGGSTNLTGGPGKP